MYARKEALVHSRASFLSIFDQPLYHTNGRKDGKQNGSNQTSNG